MVRLLALLLHAHTQNRNRMYVWRTHFFLCDCHFHVILPRQFGIFWRQSRSGFQTSKLNVLSNHDLGTKYI